MANYYQQFSVELALDNQEEKDWCADRIGQLEHTRENEDEEAPGIGFDGEGDIEKWESRADFQWCFETDAGKPKVWFSAEESGNVEQIASFVQEYLAKFHPDKHWAMEWANTCDRCRVDAFGGGAVFVTAKKVTFMNTGTWCHKQATAFEKRRKRK